jgi:RhtB (resistance to homoserine/threonine) family protein
MHPLAPLVMVATLWTIAAITPGPNFLMMLRVATTHSRARGLMAVAGIGVGTTIWGCAGLFGIHALFSAAPWLYLGFKIVGGLYLIYFGSRLLMQSRRKSAQGAIEPAERLSDVAAFRLGLMTNLANPKTALFMASVFATAMPGRPSLTLGASAITLMAAISITWYVLVTCLFTMPPMARAYERMTRWIDRAAGVLFIVFGARLALSR